MAAVTVNLRQTNANQANAWQMSKPFLHSKQKKKNRIIFLDVSRLLANRWRPVFFFIYFISSCFVFFSFFFFFFGFFWTYAGVDALFRPGAAFFTFLQRRGGVALLIFT